jgi:hypothetical protein
MTGTYIISESTTGDVKTSLTTVGAEWSIEGAGGVGKILGVKSASVQDRNQGVTVAGDIALTGTVNGVSIAAGCIGASNILVSGGVYVNGGQQIIAPNGSLFMYDASVLERHIAPGAITTPKIAFAAIRTEHIAPQTVTISRMADASVGMEQIVDSSVTESKLGNASVTTPKIGAAAITALQIAENAVQTVHIAPSNVTRETIAASNVLDIHLTTSCVLQHHISTDAVHNIHMADNAVATSNIQDASVVSRKIADEAIISATIAPGAVLHSHISPNAVRTVNVIDAAITTDKIADGAIMSTLVSPGQVLGYHIADFVVTSAKLANNSVVAPKLAPLSVETAKLANEAVTTDKIALRAITSDLLSDLDGVNLIGPLMMGGSQMLDTDRNLLNIASIDAIGPYSIAGSQVIDSSCDFHARNLSISNTLFSGGSQVLDSQQNVTNVRSMSMFGPLSVGGSQLVDSNRNVSNVATMSMMGPLLVGGSQLADSNRNITSVSSLSMQGPLNVGGVQIVDSLRNVTNLATLSMSGPLNIGGSQVFDSARNGSNIGSFHIRGPLLVNGLQVMDTAQNTSLGGSQVFNVSTRSLQNITNATTSYMYVSSNLFMGGTSIIDNNRNMSNLATLSMSGPLNIGGLQVFDSARNGSNIGSFHIRGPLLVNGIQVMDSAQNLSIGGSQVFDVSNRSLQNITNTTTSYLNVSSNLAVGGSQVLLINGGVEAKNIRKLTVLDELWMGASQVLVSSSNLLKIGRVDIAGPMFVGGSSVITADRKIENIKSVSLLGKEVLKTDNSNIYLQNITTITHNDNIILDSSASLRSIGEIHAFGPVKIGGSNVITSTGDVVSTPTYIMYRMSTPVVFPTTGSWSKFVWDEMNTVANGITTGLQDGYTFKFPFSGIWNVQVNVVFANENATGFLIITKGMATLEQNAALGSYLTYDYVGPRAGAVSSSATAYFDINETIVSGFLKTGDPVVSFPNLTKQAACFLRITLISRAR